ncbi:permease [Nautilia sp. PV-1]|uniref:LptF/LptG family permease n=1 Tax=Nautilia sp. PV-1 TaxID=2579250 RepID=UPI000FDC9D10|nr:LptF/LptG family permease [Nautilia sp. PV-1]AZV46777.1 permease [Nautilia sp. PV-1]
MFFIFILKKYLKNFLLILFSLSFFFVIVDLIANYSRLPDSSNLQVLYVYYIMLYSFDMFYALALVFSFILTLYYMIKFNELVSFYSLGFTIKKLLKPFMFFAIAVFALFLVLDSGKFAYVREYANFILNNNKYSSTNLFIKYNDKVVYIKKIEPILKQADDIKVFYLKGRKVTKIISAKKALFKNDIWYAKKAKITYLNDKRIVNLVDNVYFLKDFKPKIISNLKNLNSISFYDAFIAIKLFKDINVNTLLSIVFYKVFTALSFISLLIILMFKTPVHQRVSNVSLFLVKSVFLTIFTWGIQLMIYKFAKQGVLSPYVLVIPFAVLFSYGIFLLYKEK